MRTFLVLCASLGLALTPANAQPPNIVLIVADDLGYKDLACYGSELHRTPRIDALVAQGVRFTDAYANAPNCAPSRASLLTGLYTPRHGIYTVGSSARGKAQNRKLIPIENTTVLADEHVTLAEVLQAAGYATASIGKWHLGEDPRTQGFDINLAGDAKGHPPTYHSPYRIPTLPDGPEGEYLTDRLTDEAIGFIETNENRPFFLYLSHFAVHTPIQAPADLLAEQRERKRELPGLKPAYGAMVENLDTNIGRVLDTLDEFDLRERTIVVFFSDNGGHGAYADHTPLRGSKGMLYEGGIRVPLIISWAGHIGSREDASPVIGTDLTPTLLDLAGIAHDRALDGVSLKPLLLRGEPLDERPIFWHFPAYLEAYRGMDMPWRTAPAGVIRLGNFKLIEVFETGTLELYNLTTPTETVDLAENNPTLTATLHAQLKAWRDATNAPVPTEVNRAFKPDSQ